MESKRKGFSESAQKVYDYLLETREATKDDIIKHAELTLQVYLEVKKELVEKGKVKGIKSRIGGLRLISENGPKKSIRQSRKKRTTPDQEKANFGLSQKASELYRLIPEDGRSVTNQSLRFKLRPKGVSYDDYYNYRKELLDKELILLGRGQGGTVSRNLGEPPEGQEQETKRPKEDKALYEEIKKWLEKDETKNIDQQGLEAKVFAAVTANPSGYKQRSGRWSRPDAMLVAFASYPRLTQKTDMTVKSYEIKRYDRNLINDPANVFEAASHQKGAHYSYLVIALLGHEASGIQGDTEEAPADLVPLLERFGVGFAWFYKTGKDTYDMNIVLEAERHNPDPADENEMVNNIYQKLTKSEQADFNQWTRG